MFLMIFFGEADARLGSGCWTCGILEVICSGENRDGDMVGGNMYGSGRSRGERLFVGIVWPGVVVG